jgi:hypothetical protein
LKDCAEILDVFQKFGHNEVDTALVYGGGSSEQYLGQLDWQKRGIIMDTKFSPRAKRGDDSGTTLTHSPEDLRIALKRSLESLKTDKVDMWYLHAPDRSVPYEVTMEEVNNLYKQGKFIIRCQVCACELTSIVPRLLQTLWHFQLRRMGSCPNLRDLRQKWLDQTRRLPRRLQRPPPPRRTRTLPLLEEVRHLILRVQPSCWWVSHLALPS